MHQLLRFSAIFLLLIQPVFAQNDRLLNQTMVIKNCNVNITVNCFHATTQLELEFYNHRLQEIEGLIHFTLKPQQAITGFELDLNGKYRKGTIEERWKANNAYNTVVGKRIDPALLQMTGTNMYSLNIYPIAPKNSRRVKITIEEILPLNKEQYEYRFEMFKTHTVEMMNIKIATPENLSAPVNNEGLISRTTFNKSAGFYVLNDQYNSPVSGGYISFNIPAPGQISTHCLNPDNGNFSAKFADTIPETVTREVKKLRVYWDRSASMRNEDVTTFTSFLFRQIKQWNVTELLIVPFNYKTGNARLFTGEALNAESVRKAIKNVPLYGPTNFGDLSMNTDDDLVFVFTDGKHTWGSRNTETNKTPVIFIVADYYDPVYKYRNYSADFNYASYYGNYYNYNQYNYQQHQQVPVVRLEDVEKNFQYPNVQQRKIELVSAVNEFGKPVTISALEKLNGYRIVKGQLPLGSKTLTLNFGYGNKILYTQKIVPGVSCSEEICKRINTLLDFEFVVNNRYNWYQLLGYGIDNKIVTWQTAFIVLERIEDYVRFNITPPDEIMEECIRNGFVKRDYKQQYYHLQRANDAEMLKLVAGEYNKRLQFHNSNAAPIKLNEIAGSFARIEEEKKSETQREMASMDSYAMNKSFGASANSLSEVVVTGYSTRSKKMIGYSATQIHSEQLMGSVTLSQALQGRLAGVQVINTPGSTDIAQLRIRGVGSLSGNGNPLYVLDGVPTSFDLINQLIPSEVANVTVIRSPEGSAIYGVRGANGVILVQTKRANNYGYKNPSTYTRLKEAEDEEYMMDIKLTDTEQKYHRYQQLKEENKTNMAFFLDMAIHFSETGLSQYIEEMMLEAAEISNNDYISLQAIAFVYEYIRNFKRAAEIYGELAKSYPGNLKLLQQQAWAVYEGGQPDSAVQMLYRAITREDYTWNTYNMQAKEAMLTDMNMIIAVHPNEVNTKYIPAEIIRPVTANMRIQLFSNSALMHTLSARAGDKQITPGASTGKYKLAISYTGYDMADLTALEKGNGRLRLTMKHFDTWYANQVPPMVKIVTIRDFGKPGQRIHTELVSLKNQFGEVEIADLKQ